MHHPLLLLSAALLPPHTAPSSPNAASLTTVITLRALPRNATSAPVPKAATLVVTATCTISTFAGSTHRRRHRVHRLQWQLQQPQHRFRPLKGGAEQQEQQAQQAQQAHEQQQERWRAEAEWGGGAWKSPNLTAALVRM
jgi:TolA-binding protein